MRTPRSGGANSPSVSSSSSVTVPQPSQPQQQQPQRASRRQQQHSNHHQRYHFNHLEAGMPVNVWGIDRRDVWRTCFCFHVRTVTIFIGVWHLMVYILCLSFIAAMFMYEPPQYGNSNGMTDRPDLNMMLPTPVSKIGRNNEDQYEMPRQDSLTVDQSENARPRLDNIGNGPLNMVMDTKKANSQVVLLTVCNMLITLLMVYGAVRGKPSYLMPFFVLRVFDFCIFCLTMVGYFSYLPNVTEGISNSRWLPYREYLLDMDPQLLSLLTLVVIVATIAVKAYIIGVIWNCYKYLMLRNSVIRTVIAYRHDDPTNLMGLQQNLLPDLPDYDTAVNDPRYAKKPPLDSTQVVASQNPGNPVMGASSIAMPPPPPYSVAIAAEPLTFNFSIPTHDQTTTQEHIQQESEQSLPQVETQGQNQTSVEISDIEEPVPEPVTVQPAVQIDQNTTPTVVSQIIEVSPAPVVSVESLQNN